MSVRKLQLLLRSWFGFVALAYGLSAITLTPKLFLSPLPHTTATFHEQGTGLVILAVLLVILQRLIFAIPLLLTSVFGVTWWKLKFAKPGARRWGIAASIVMLLSAIPLLVPTWWMWHEGYTDSMAVICILLILGSLASGVAGLFAFSGKESQSAIEVEAQPPRVAGDGTHKLLDVLALALQFGGTLTLISLYTRWGYDHDLPISHGVEAWMQWILVIAGATLIHESAHALVGIAVGMKLRAFIIGPFQFRVFDGRWIFEFRPTQILAFSGAAGLTPVDPDQSRWNEVVAIAAGPFANLLTGAVAAALAYSAEKYAWWSFWEYFALFATVSLVAGIVNLIPLQPSGLYSDGARIVQLFRRGPVADYQRAVRSIAAGNVSSRGPRTYDIQAIQCALVHYDKGEAALRLKLCSMDHFSDSGQFAEASRALEEAEHLYLAPATDAPPDLLTVFVINVVLLRRDVVAAGKWWHVVQSKKPTIFNADYWLAKCAFHWSEGDLAAASEAWNTGQAYLEKLPGTGGCNYDRNCYLRMKEVLTSPPAEAADTSNAAPTAVNLPIEPVATPTFE